MAVCGAYYYLWMHLLPKWRRYTIRPQVLEIDGDTGANTHRLVRVPNAEVAEWDSVHDEQGRIRRRAGADVISKQVSKHHSGKEGSGSSENAARL